MHVVHRSGYKVAGPNTSRNPARDDLLLRYRLTSDTVMLPSNGSNLSMVVTAGAYEEGMQKKRKEKTTPFGINLMRSQVLYRAAQERACNNMQKTSFLMKSLQRSTCKDHDKRVCLLHQRKRVFLVHKATIQLAFLSNAEI